MCDRLAVMYHGRIVELGPTAEVLAEPRHPYTRSLVSAYPRIGGPRLTDDLPQAVALPDAPHPAQGCRYRSSCPVAMPACATVDPTLVPEGRRAVACLHWPQPPLP